MVRPADKGDAIVLKHASDYETEICEQLDDHVFYECLPCDPTYNLKMSIHSKLLLYFEKGDLN